MNGLYSFGAQFLQPQNLGVDIVGFDIEVYAARMVHLLDLDIETVLRILEPFVERGFIGRQFAHGHAERTGPEIRGAPEIVGLAIDDESRKFAFVHCFLQICAIHENIHSEDGRR